jgi:hypothetical protein
MAAIDKLPAAPRAAAAPAPPCPRGEGTLRALFVQPTCTATVYESSSIADGAELMGQLVQQLQLPCQPTHMRISQLRMQFVYCR